ncbi:MAG: hypothetical protein ACXWLT_11660 [Rhizomicrobium sp.]
MQRIAVASLAIVLIGSFGARAVEPPAAASALDDVAKSHIKWNVAKARVADVTCDGRADTIMFGSAKGSVWIGVVSGGNGRAQVIRFSISPSRQDGFSALPKGISIHPLVCEDSEAGRLDGCKQVRGCKEFSMGDEESDPFNFYWDSRRKIIRWWRN